METIDQINADIVFRQDAKGRLVPEAMIRPIDRLEDQLVRKVMIHAEELSKQIARFKGHCFDDVGAFMALIAEQYGAKKGGVKGNVTLTSFDGCLKMQISIADNLTFGPELQIAKSLIDECINEWAADARSEIRVLVEHAFRTDKEGKVNREAIFALRRIEIDDPRWKKAMEAVGDSIRVVGSKTYIRFYRRETPEDAWSHVTIDLASA